MNISYRWLQEFVQTTTKPVELGEKFRMTSSECEGVQTFGTLAHIYTGHIDTVEQHPDAERLKVTRVTIGNTSYTIVTNATNVRAGATCIVALTGATVLMGSENVTITPTKLRGVLSEGMFCSLAELGLPSAGHSEGIWLSDDATIPQGILVTEALDLNDSVIDLEITPNRPDLLSYVGLAREVSAFEHKTLRLPATNTLNPAKNLKLVRVTIEDPKMCSRYAAIRVEGNLTQPSPWWIQKRLILSGIRPISAIVDVTNYVLLETGQPLHAFSVDSKKPVVFHVRSAHTNEELALLDGTTHKLKDGDIIVADEANNPIDLAGIMGGAHSSITDGTTSALIESAHFHGPQIRRTSRRLGIRTEASSRFEKGINPENVAPALERAAYLLNEICGATVVDGLFDLRPKQPHPQPVIHLTYEGIQQILGVHISAQECKSILQKLGFTIQNMNKAGFQTTPPSWRADVTLPEDIIEELIRIWGYDRIPHTTLSGVIKAPQPNQHFNALHSIREKLVSLGGYECITTPFLSKRQIELCELQPNNCIALPNPLSSEHAYLAPSHLPGFLANITGTNSDIEEIVLFEIGKVFSKPATETEKLSILIRSNIPVEQVVQRGKLLVQSISKNAVWKYDNHSATLNHNGQDIGILRVLSQSIVQSNKIRRAKSIVFIELNTSELLQTTAEHAFYKPLPQFPSIERDITLILHEEVTISQVEQVILHSQNLLTHEVVKVYRGAPLPENHKAVTIHFIYNGKDRTLTDAEINIEHQSQITNFRKTLNATIND